MSATFEELQALARHVRLAKQNYERKVEAERAAYRDRLDAFELLQGAEMSFKTACDGLLVEIE